MVTLDLSEVEAPERDIRRAETLLQEHNVRTGKGTAQTLQALGGQSMARFCLGPLAEVLDQ